MYVGHLKLTRPEALALKKQNQEHKQTLESTTQMIATIQSEFKTKEVERQNLLKKNEQTDAQLRQQESTLASQQKTIQELEETVEKLRVDPDQIRVSRNHYQEMENRLEEMNREIVNYDEMKIKLECLQSKLEQQTIEEMRNIEDEKARSDRARLTLEDKFTKQIIELNKKLQDNYTELEQQKKSKQDLEVELSRARCNLSDVEEKNSALEMRVNQNTQNSKTDDLGVVEDYVGQIEIFRKQVASLVKDKGEEEEARRELKYKADGLENEIISLKTQLRKSEESYLLLQTLHEKEVSEIRAMTVQCQEKLDNQEHEKNKEFQKEKELFERKATEQQQLLVTIDTKFCQLQHMYQVLKEKEEGQEKLIEKKDLELSRSREDSEKLLEKKDLELSRSREEVRSLSELLKKNEEELLFLRSEHLRIVEELKITKEQDSCRKMEIERVKGEQEGFLGLLEDRTTKLSWMEGEFERNKTESEKLKEQFESLKRKSEAEKSSLEEELYRTRQTNLEKFEIFKQEVEATLERTRASLLSKEEECERYREQEGLMRLEVSRLELKVHELDGGNQQFRREGLVQAEEIERLKEELKVQRNGFEEEIRSCRSEILEVRDSATRELENKRREVEDVTQAFERKIAEVLEQRKAVVEELKEDLDKERKGLDSLTLILNRKLAESKQKDDMIADFTEKLSREKERSEDLEGKSKEQVETFETLKRELQRQLTDVKNQLEEQKKRSKVTEEALGSQKALSRELQEKLEKYDEEVNNLKKELEVAKETARQKRLVRRKVTADAKKLQLQLEETHEELKQVRKQMKDGEERMMKQIKNFEMLIDNKESERKQETGLNLEKIQRLQGMLQEMADEKMGLEKKNQLLEDDMKKLEKARRDLEGKVKGMEVETHRSSELISKMSSEVEKKEKELQLLTIRDSKMAKTNEDYQEEIKRLKEEVACAQVMKEAFERMKREGEKSQVDLKRLNELVETLYCERHEAEIKEKGLREKQSELEMVLAVQRQDLTQAKCQLVVLEQREEQIRSLQEKLKDLEKLTDDLSVATDQIKILQEENLQLQHQMKDEQIGARACERQNGQLIKQLQNQVRMLQGGETLSGPSSSPRSSSGLGVKKVQSVSFPSPNKAKPSPPQEPSSSSSPPLSPSSSPHVQRKGTGELNHSSLQSISSPSSKLHTSLKGAEGRGRSSTVGSTHSSSPSHSPDRVSHQQPPPISISPPSVNPTKGTTLGTADKSLEEENALLYEDLEKLGKQIGELQEEKFKMEGMIAKLNSEVRSLRKETTKKK
eukprot:TRINITY_DN3363_c0_g1_i8.p1 TRINITY_DN3363_c0_g1~~TRINITY_DN3363_c0_g1_i8.p1  ORF type:complete len:1285 (-),score=438.95 TRINITY_DN3363_c0_g1_i8:597-4451(-)